MDINLPKLRFGTKTLSICALFLCVAFLANILGLSAIQALTTSLGCVFFVMVVGALARRKKLITYLRKHGTAAQTSDLNEEDYKSVLGSIPVSGGHGVVIVYVNQIEIIFGRLGCYRKINWDEITFLREDSYAQKSVVEICAESAESKNRLCIPWSRNFKRFIPEDLL